MEKKKRHISGSRSKSKKNKPNDFSVDFKPHKVSHTLPSHEHSSKNKTQNSISVNKSKGSRKHSKQSKKSNICHGKDSKDISCSVSAQRKHSLAKINRTEANFEAQDVEKKIYQFKKTLNNINRPKQVNIDAIKDFYGQIRETIETISQPLYSICIYLHQMYLQPFTNVLSIIMPYEDVIRKKEQLSRQIQNQLKENERLYKQLDPTDIEIYQLKQTIEEQRLLIQQKKIQKGSRIKQMQQKRQIELKHQKQQEEEMMKKNKKQIQIDLESAGQQANSGAKGFKLDLQAMNKRNHVGFHDQFYSKLDEFSQSWRNQAIREKRF